MLKGEKIMRERLGFFYEGTLIMRLPWYGIITKVTKTDDGTLIAERMPYDEYSKIVEQEEGKKDRKRKMLIIFGMIIFYVIMAYIFAKLLGIYGLALAGYFFIITNVPLYDILSDITYAFCNKEKMQYAYLFKKLEQCCKEEVNEENLKNIDMELGTFSLRTIVLAIVMSIVMTLVKDLNAIIQLIIFIIIGFVFVRISANPKIKKILIRLKVFLVYRKPTEEQIDMFLFAHKYISKEAEIVRENYEF